MMLFFLPFLLSHLLISPLCTTQPISNVILISDADKNEWLSLKTALLDISLVSSKISAKCGLSGTPLRVRLKELTN